MIRNNIAADPLNGDEWQIAMGSIMGLLSTSFQYSNTWWNINISDILHFIENRFIMNHLNHYGRKQNFRK